ncbi:TetR/AcrR family transcriptional regulator [Haloferax sp. Atlit-10N]|uniref:TetR/AcrR family transcriptional regulator n=1 Tax=Haloferax TaxID=2251 RepID=UPI00067983C2|nr:MULTISPECIES: TetR/AcrR family transcriptional regulator [Haloferax]RDZ44674.1 TetR/AcrR family transcriptional regulator [Haloferax sp. Atlit-16N]RDZ59546.1 TetR/AcrR family transcriptional regulator [Haloferax sp. Atlit-10N]
MSADETPDQSVPDEVHEELMAATYRALCAHGYADLTMQRIADEAGKSKSLLHYHYGTKQELLVAFLGYLFDRFEERVAATEGDAPETRLRVLLDKMVPDGDDDGDYDRFGLALNELRTQAPYVEAYREQVARNEAIIRRRLADIIREGVEEGHFREVDADRTASLLFAALDGARLQRVAVTDPSGIETASQSAFDAPTEVRAALDEFVVENLVREEGDE